MKESIEFNLDRCIQLFLEKYDVFIEPCYDYKLQNQTAVQAWIKWKQWALDHKNFETYKNKDYLNTMAKVKSLVSKQLEMVVEEIDIYSKLKTDLGADELDYVELVMHLEEEFNIDLDLEKFISVVIVVEDILNLVLKAKKEKINHKFRHEENMRKVKNSELISEPIKILLIHEDNELKEYIKDFINYEGYYVLKAENKIFNLNDKEITLTCAETGLIFAQRYLPDLIILDLLLEKIDGVTLTRRLKMDFKTSNIPIIMITSHSKSEDQIKAMKYNMEHKPNLYISKPFDSEELIEKIEVLLGVFSYNKKIYREKT